MAGCVFKTLCHIRAGFINILNIGLFENMMHRTSHKWLYGKSRSKEVEAVDPTCTVIFKEKKLSVRLSCYYDILLESSIKYFGPIFYFGSTKFHHVGIKPQFLIKLTILRKF